MKSAIGCTKIVFMLLFFLMVSLPVRAEEADTGDGKNEFAAGTVWEIARNTDVKETPDGESRTKYVFTAGTSVVLLEEEQDGWCLVQNQENVGYIPTNALQIYGEENMEAMSREFEETVQEQTRVVEEYEIYKREKNFSLVWKILIIGFFSCFFGLSVYDAFRKNEKRNSDSI